MTADSTLAELPGADLVRDGIRDLERGDATANALLIAMAAPRLRHAGVDVPAGAIAGRPSHQLYELLASENGLSAHSRYNALVRRIVSFARAAEHARSG